MGCAGAAVPKGVWEAILPRLSGGRGEDETLESGPEGGEELVEYGKDVFIFVFELLGFGVVNVRRKLL